MTLDAAYKEAKRRANSTGNSYIICRPGILPRCRHMVEQYMVCLTVPIHALRVSERIYPQRREAA